MAVTERHVLHAHIMTVIETRVARSDHDDSDKDTRVARSDHDDSDEDTCVTRSDHDESDKYTCVARSDHGSDKDTCGCTLRP